MRGAYAYVALGLSLAVQAQAQSVNYYDWAEQAGAAYGLPSKLMSALVWQESRANPYALSSAGAIGLAQLMPGTARELGVDPYDPWQNLMGGAKYLRRQWDQFKNWRLALAAYNAGPGNVMAYGDVPPFKQTQDYVKSVLGTYASLQPQAQPVVAQVAAVPIAAPATPPKAPTQKAAPPARAGEAATAPSVPASVPAAAPTALTVIADKPSAAPPRLTFIGAH